MYARHPARKLFEPLCGISAACLYPKGIKRKAHFVGRGYFGKTLDYKLTVFFFKLLIVIMVHKILAVFL